MRLTTKAVEQKKSQRANLEDKRLTGFLIGLVVTLSLFLAALQYSTSAPGDNSDKDKMDEETPDADLLPKPKRSEMIAVIQPKPKKTSTQKLKIVEEKEQAEKLNNITQMRTIGSDEDREQEDDKDDRKADKDAPETIAIDLNDNPLNFRIVEQLPEYPGGMAALVKWLNDNLRYPPLAQRQNIQGRVVVTFIINRDGTTCDLKVAKSGHPLLDGEAMRVLKNMKKWKPGVNNNKPCRTLFAIPIEFKI